MSSSAPPSPGPPVARLPQRSAELARVKPPSSASSSMKVPTPFGPPPSITRVTSMSEVPSKKLVGSSPAAPSAKPPSNLPSNLPHSRASHSGCDPHITGAMSFSANVSRRVGGLSKSWKENELRIEPIGTLSFSEGGSIMLSGSRVEIPWLFDAKVGQRFLAILTDPNQAKEQIQLGSASELDECLQVLVNHGCSVHRPIKYGALVVDKKPAWCVLYPDCFQYFKLKTDPKPTKVIQITEASLLERMTDDSFLLAESGDEQANGVSFPLSPSEEKEWLDILEQTIANRADKKCQDSLLEGYIWKCGETGGFKRRFCVLRLENIRYYKRRFDEQAAGIIRLNPGAEAGAYEDSANRRYQFWVSESGDEGIRKYLMATKTEAEKELWLQTIAEVFACKDNQVHSQSLKEGYLHKRSKKGRWKKYYFILIKDMVMFRKKRNDFIFASETPKGVIDLNQAFELQILAPSSENGLNKPGLFTLAANGDEEGTRTYILQADDDVKRAQWIDTLVALRKTKNLNVNPRSFKEGYLTKRAEKRDKWSKRYFILLEDRLLYFRRRQDTVERGDIKIEGAAELAEIDPDDSEYKYRFSIVESGDDQGKRMYFISCPSVEVRTQWMSCITKIINAHDSRVMPGSLLEGYLWKCPKNGGTWQKRYFILKQNQLSYLKKRLDKTEAGTVEIKGEAQISVMSDPEHPFAFCVAKNGDAGVRQFLLHARDDATRYEWVSQLRQQASLCAVKEVADSMLEGYVYLAASGNSWRKRYFILEKSPPSLSLLTKRKDLKPALKLVIDTRTVVALLDNKLPFHGSLWGKHEGEDATPNTLEKEEKDVASGDAEEAEEGASGKGDGLQMIVAKNGDFGGKVTRLKGAGESEALLISNLMELCIREEFPSGDSQILKSGYIMVRLQTKSDRWVSSYVEISVDRLMCFKGQDDEFPVLVVSLDEGAQLFSGVLPGSGEWKSLTISVIDKSGREISLRAQCEEEKLSWALPLIKCISSLKDGHEFRRTTLFGADLKISFSCSCFYDFPSVIGACVEYLKKSPCSGCLLRHPGFHPLVRSFIQDFELKLDVPLVDTSSVAACLKMYLMMLPKPIVPDAAAKTILDILRAKPNDPGNAVQISKVIQGLERENNVALNVLLYYLAHEINRPEEVELTLPKVASIWGPLLIRYSEDGKDKEEHKSLILSALIRSLKMTYPAGPLTPVRRLPPAKLQQLKSDLDLTFEALRKDEYGMKVYGRFVKDSFIDENLQFFLAVERYREMCNSSKYTADKRSAAGAEICKKYVAQGAEIQINVSALLSETILARFDPNVRRVLTGGEFSEAETECHLLEATNSFPRFKKTEGFDEWVTHCYEIDQKFAAASPRKTVLAPPPQASAIRRGPPPRPKVEGPESPISSVRFSRLDVEPLSRNASDESAVYRNSSARHDPSYLRSSESCQVRSSDSSSRRHIMVREESSTSTDEPPSPIRGATPPLEEPVAASLKPLPPSRNARLEDKPMPAEKPNPPARAHVVHDELALAQKPIPPPRSHEDSSYKSAHRTSEEPSSSRPIPPARTANASFVRRAPSLPNLVSEQRGTQLSDAPAPSKPLHPARTRAT